MTRTIEIPTPLRNKADEIAKQEARKLGDLNGSIENGKGNYAGIFGEVLFTELIGGRRRNTYDYDIIYNGLKIDVKTKRRSVKPQPHYEASIADHNTSQDCDLYYFISVRDTYEHATFLGHLSPEEYFERAAFHEAGEKDPDNGFEFKADCYNVPHAELKFKEGHIGPVNDYQQPIPQLEV